MKNEAEPNLEQLIHRELRRLPGWKAPTNLVPRVLAAIQAKAHLVWWQQPFWAWPRTAQAVFSVALTAIIGVLIRLGWTLGDILTSETWPQPVQHFFTLLGYLWEGLVTLINAVSIVMHSGLQIWLWGALAVVVLLYLCCLGAGTMFLRLAWKKI